MHENDGPSLGHYLEEERRVAAPPETGYRRNESSPVCCPNDFSPVFEANSLFVEDHVAPHCDASMEEEGGGEPNRALLEQSNGYGGPVIFPCLCG